MSAPRTTTHVGVAVGADRVVAAAPGTRGADPLAWTAPLAGAPRDGAWPELEAALADLRGRIGARAAVMDVALLPPGSAVRVLKFPRLRPHELTAVLRRDARRHFLEARGAQVAAARVLGAAGEGRVRVLAAVAPEALAEAVHHAAASAGWRVAVLVPAVGSWAAAASLLAGPEAQLLVAADGWVDAVGVRRGEVATLRRVPALALEDDPPPTAVVGAPTLRATLEAQLFAAGGEVRTLPVDAAWLDDPATLAAGFAGRSPLRFTTAAAEEGALRRSRRLALVLGGAAVAMLLAASGLEVWGAGRELDAVRERRRELAPAVRGVSAARETLRGLDVRFATLRALEGSAPQWPVVLALVAQKLPADARLTAFRAEGDSMVIEGEARRAARVFEAMGGVPGVVQVRPAAPVRREFREGAPPVERFVLSARLGARGADSPKRPEAAR